MERVADTLTLTMLSRRDPKTLVMLEHGNSMRGPYHAQCALTSVTAMSFLFSGEHPWVEQRGAFSDCCLKCNAGISVIEVDPHDDP